MTTRYYVKHPAVAAMVRSYCLMFHIEAEILDGEGQPSGDAEIIKTLKGIEHDWAPDWIAHDAIQKARTRFNRRPHLTQEAVYALDRLIKSHPGASASELVSQAILEMEAKK